MNKEIKELFNKYGVKDLKNKNGQSECYHCKNIKHRYSLTWTSFLYEYEDDYYCFDCLLTILLQKENKELHNKIDKVIEYIKKYQQIYDIDGSIEKQIDEFNILASPKRLLEILKDSDVDE